MSEQTTNKTELVALDADKSNLKAASGKFRACVLRGSIWYHIGDDSPHIGDAVYNCARHGNREMKNVQIFDDKGEHHIIDGLLKKTE